MDAPIRILLFGGSGLVGSRIIQLLNKKYHIIAPSHIQVDLTDLKNLNKIIEETNPSYIIYSAGVSSVDEAENNPQKAYQLNTYIPEFLAKKSALKNITMLYFSSEAVFNGKKKDRPYTEDDKPNPISQYGKSKLLGEQAVLKASSQNCVARLILVYSHAFTKRKRFVQIVLDCLKKGEKFYGVTDQIINPIYVDDVVTAVDLLIQSKSSGIYHLGASDFVTIFNFAEKLAKRFDLNQDLVIGIPFKDFFKDKKALRAQFCWIDTTKFRKKFGNDILHTVDEGINLLKIKMTRRMAPRHTSKYILVTI